MLARGRAGVNDAVISPVQAPCRADAKILRYASRRDRDLP